MTEIRDIHTNGAIRLTIIYEFSFLQQYEEHAIAHIRGLLSEDQELKDINEEHIVQIYGNKNHILFEGVIQKISIFERGVSHKEIEIALISNSICYDQEKRNTIGKPLIQYYETDWEFTKRITSHVHEKVYPTIGAQSYSIGVGYDAKIEAIDVNVLKYKLKYSADHLEKEQSDQRDYLFYEIESTEDVELGSKIKFKNKEGIIFEKKGKLHNGVLIFIYKVGGKVFIQKPYQFNQNFIGRTILGSVLSTKNETVRVKLEIDKTQMESEAYDYSYEPETGNMTIDCQGKVVQINAEARVDYPIINDAPIEVKNRGMGKLLKKVLAAVAVVAVVAATAALVAAVAVASGGAALAVVGAVAVKTASAVAIGSLIGGGIAAGIGFGVQLYSDSKNGTKRDWKDYLYQGVDNFCTGAIIAAPMATPWALPAQLLGVGICSFTYQGIDNYLDEEYGGDFYDVDSNMLLNAIFDIAFAGVGSLITNGLNKGINRILNMSKSEYKSIAKFLNKFPFIKNKYPTDQANINVLKKIFREPVKKVQKFLSQKWITYLILGGEEGKIGADIPTSLFTDSNVNAIFELIINGVEDKVLSEDYDEDYNNYSRIVCEDNQSMIIDFDENGNLVME